MGIRVTVVYAPRARTVHEIPLLLDPGARAAQALSASGLMALCPELAAGPLALGIWGRKALPDTVLRDQDRVEVYRALTVDPKVARRARFVKQGVRSAGLFARKRAGSKAGY